MDQDGQLIPSQLYGADCGPLDHASNGPQSALCNYYLEAIDSDHSLPHAVHSVCLTARALITDVLFTVCV